MTSGVQLAVGFFGTFISLRVPLENFTATMSALELSGYYAGYRLARFAAHGSSSELGTFGPMRLSQAWPSWRLRSCLWRSMDQSGWLCARLLDLAVQGYSLPQRVGSMLTLRRGAWRHPFNLQGWDLYRADRSSLDKPSRYQGPHGLQHRRRHLCHGSLAGKPHPCGAAADHAPQPFLMANSRGELPSPLPERR